MSAGEMPPGWRGLRLAWGLLVWATPERATTAAGASRALVAPPASSSHAATTMSAAAGSVVLGAMPRAAAGVEPGAPRRWAVVLLPRPLAPVCLSWRLCFS